MRPLHAGHWIIMAVLVGCGGSAPVESPAKTATSKRSIVESSLPVVGPIDGVACVGSVDPLSEAVKEVSDEELAKSAIDATGKGKLCMARVFEIIAPVKVYRVWNSQKSYTEFGKWWSFAKPSGSVDEYRVQNAVCPEWSALDRLTMCDIKVGSRIVIGPGQSATCTSSSYEKSKVNQVFIPNDTREARVFVEHCEQLGTWPQEAVDVKP